MKKITTLEEMEEFKGEIAEVRKETPLKANPSFLDLIFRGEGWIEKTRVVRDSNNIFMLRNYLPKSKLLLTL